METEPSPTADSGIEIVAKPQHNFRVLLPFAPTFAACVTGLLVFSGIGPALGGALVLLLAWGFATFIGEHVHLLLAHIDEEGVTLLPRRPGHLSKRAVKFRWEEVLEVRRPPLGANQARFGMVIRLDRPRKFWSLRDQPRNRVSVPTGICQDTRFIEALRRNVPAERIQPSVLDPDAPSFGVTRTRILALLVLCCAMAVVWSVTALVSGGGFFSAMIVAAVSFLTGILVTNFCVRVESPALEFSAGILNALLLGMGMIMFAAIMSSNGAAYATAALGGGAGILIGISLGLLFRNRLPALGEIALAGTLAIAGCAWGWFSVRDLAGVHVADGSLPYVTPWTPQGDAFVTMEPGWVATLKDPGKLCWYSSDLTEKRCAELPPDSHIVAVGQKAALVVSRGDESNSLWWAPRDAVPQALGEAPGYAQAILSPNRRLALIRPRNNECEIVSWQLCEIDEGSLLTLQPPVPTDSASIAGLADDGTLLWLQGSRPRDKGERSVSHRTPLPESGKFPYPGDLYTAWTWKANPEESPVQLYAAATEWLDWRMSEKYGRIRVCRISEKTPARIEYVLLDITRQPVEETLISEEDFERNSYPSQSADGRFVVSTRKSKSSVFAPAVIRDTQTDKEWRVPYANTLFCLTVGPRWSPSSDVFLIETVEMRLGGGLWQWRRTSEDLLEQTTAIYLVDMERQ